MFVKRDLRKINELIHDPEAVKNLSLSRRPAEFSSSLKPLINPTNLPLLSPVLTLSVYDCEIDDVTALGKLGGTNVQEINIGRNPVKILPNDLAVVDSLTRFWAEDCLLEGEVSCQLPVAVFCQLPVASSKIILLYSHLRSSFSFFVL